MTVFSPDGLLTVREVAETMRVSTMTVYRLIKAHELSATRVGKHFRIRRADLSAYLDARRVGPPPAQPAGVQRHGAHGNGAQSSGAQSYGGGDQ